MDRKFNIQTTRVHSKQPSNQSTNVLSPSSASRVSTEYTDTNRNNNSCSDDKPYKSSIGHQTLQCIRQQERNRVRERQIARSDNQGSIKSKEFTESVRIKIKSATAITKHEEIRSRTSSGADEQRTKLSICPNNYKRRKHDTNRSISSIKGTIQKRRTINSNILTLDAIIVGGDDNSSVHSVSMINESPIAPMSAPLLKNKNSKLRYNAMQYTPRNLISSTSVSTQIETCSPTSSLAQSPPYILPSPPSTAYPYYALPNEPYSNSIAHWLQTSNPDCITVYPVWIGNLPSKITITQLRTFVEAKIGCVLISIYIGGGRSMSPSAAESVLPLLSPNSKKQTYAFLNFPCFDKQTKAVKLLDNQSLVDICDNINGNMCLIARAKRQSKFPFLNYSLNDVQNKYETHVPLNTSCVKYNTNMISEHFKYFKDSILPIILDRLQLLQNTVNDIEQKCTETTVLNAIAVILEENAINVNFLPNRLWCVECNLKNKCSRKYCSFHHSTLEKQLGDIFAKLVNKKYDEKKMKFILLQQMQQPNANVLSPNAYSSDYARERSRHTLFIQGLPEMGSYCDGQYLRPSKYMSTKNAQLMHDRILTLFETFGTVEQVIVNADQTCFLRMRYAQSAQVIEHLFRSNDNRTGIMIGFPLRSFITVDNAIYCGLSYAQRKNAVLKSTKMRSVAEGNRSRLAVVNYTPQPSFPTHMNVNSVQYLQNMQQQMQKQYQQQWQQQMQQMQQKYQQWQFHQIKKMQKIMEVQQLMQNQSSSNSVSYAPPTVTPPVPEEIQNISSSHVFNVEFENDAQQIFNQIHDDGQSTNDQQPLDLFDLNELNLNLENI